MKKEMMTCFAVLAVLVILPVSISATTTAGKATLYDWYAPDAVVTSGWGDGGFYYWYYFDATSPPSSAETATYSFVPSQSGLYDVAIYTFLRDDYTTDAQYVINFKSGGTYLQNANELLVTGYDNTNAAAGQVKVSVDLTTGTSSRAHDTIFLGRYQMDAATTYTLIMTTDGMAGSGFIATPQVGFTGPQVANTDLLYEDIDTAVAYYTYSNWVGSPNNYWWSWRWNTETWNTFCKVVPFPSSDRNASGWFDLEVTEVYGGATDQPPDIPITVYFEPGTSYTPPTIGGMITGVDESQAAQGIIVVDVDTRSAGTVSLGNYYFDKDSTYCAELRNYPVDLTGMTGCFVRKHEWEFTNFTSPPATPNIQGKATLLGWYAPDTVVTSGWGDGGFYYWYSFNAASPPSPAQTATYSFTPSQSGLYDVAIYTFLRDDYTTDAQYVINFKPGGGYLQNANELRVTSYDNTNAAAGQVTVSANLREIVSFARANDTIFLGRYEMDAATTYTLVMTTDGMAGSGFIATPQVGFTGPQIANTDLLYEDIDAAVAYDTYSNWVGSPNDYWWSWRWNTETWNTFCKINAFPASDRSGSPSGSYDLKFTEVYGGATDQPPDVPITVYFEPGTSYTPPTVSGMITGVDQSQAAQGIIVVDVDTRTAGSVILGSYYFDNAKSYCVEVRNYPVDLTGMTGCFLRKFEWQFIRTEVEDWFLY